MSEAQEKFAGGVAVVTGAGAGIGMGIARRLAALGMHVVVTDIEGERAEATVDGIAQTGGSAEAMVVDVSRHEALDRLATTVFAKHGAVRVLVNNAGIETIGNCWEIPAARWEATLNINIHGVVHGCRAFIPHMLKQGEEAWIANLASIGAFGTMPQQTAYIMTKHAVQAFSECLYLELQEAGAPIHVASVIPGMLKTSIFEASVGAGEPDAARHHRRVMYEMMKAHGMELDEGCTIIIDKIAANAFWVDTQPEMTAQSIAGRIAFLSERNPPKLADQARAILQASA